MNKNAHRLVYSRLLGGVVAVAETATAKGKSATGEARARRRALASGVCVRVVVAGVAVLGMLPALSHAQIVPTPGTSTQVIQTPNGLPQVNVARPSGAGVSVNTYHQFDVQKPGAILNNSAAMVQTRQAGWINGNPNYGTGQAARISMTAGNALHVTGSDLIAAKNLSGTGASVTIDAAQHMSHRGETQKVSKSGLTLALKAPVIDAISNAVDQSRASGNSQDGRAAALHGIAAASAAWDANMAAGDLVKTLAAGEAPQFKVEISVGGSRSKSAFSEDSVTNRGSNVTAGGTAAFAATGGAQPGSGNVAIVGSNLNANDVILAAKNKIDIINTTDTDSTRTTNESKSVGVSVGTGGFGISAAMSKANGDGNSDLATQNNSHVNAANGVTIISGGDTNLIGANVKGNQVNADVGGNLNIASVQDTLSSAAHQSSTGGGFSVSQSGGASASFSHSKGNASGSYAGVNEQAGIQAGDGGFNINVGGNTDLKGGLIASDADASKNTLTTGSLSFTDMQNQSHYDAKSSGFGGGATTGDGGMNYSTHGSTSGKNAGGVSPMLGQHDSGSDSATTKSGVSAGTVTITDSAKQKQDVGSLNRETTDANGTVGKLPDMQNLLSNQADMMAAASAAGEAVSRRIGDYADKMKKDAAANGDQAGVDAWKEGGANRALMQGAGAALMTGIAGGNAVGGAAGAAIASIASGKLNELSSAISGSDPTGNADMNQALGNIVANAFATGAGAVMGGESGAFSGHNVDRFNRQLHPDEYARAKKDAKVVAKQLGITEQEAEGRIVAEMLRNSDKLTSDTSGGVHDYQVRAIIGCQNLNCGSYKSDSQFGNHNYNNQYIISNQQAYDAGQIQTNKGVTYNDLVMNNVKNNPVSTGIAGAGMVALGGAIVGGMQSVAGMLAGGSIGATVNAGAQYVFNNGQINLVDTGFAGVTGALTFGTGVLSGLLINTGGALTGAAMKGDNPNWGMIGSAAGTVVGYKVGGWIESGLGKVVNPWYRPEWVDISFGVSKYVPSSALPSLGGTALGAMGFEGTNGIIGIIVTPSPELIKK